MFERFDDRARQVVVRAQEEARDLNHNHIGTEHLLLAVLRDPRSVSARALGTLGVSWADARQHLEAIRARGDKPSRNHLPFTPRGKKALELSLREALQLHHQHIGDGHILLGVIREGEGVAVQVLDRLEVDLADLRGRVIELLADAQEEPAPDDALTEVGMQPGIAIEIEDASGDAPRCGRCNAPAAGNVRQGTVPVPPPNEDGPETVTLVWCGVCGAVFGVTHGVQSRDD